ncbi:MAG: TRAP transporter substrate-binding protein [Burkholderiales bacterium]|nr:MAG: TRAP transporter substrate-binding protein [Burkholderiales bacterium]RPH66944.1 MAG: TRAP transporter substrate-binding protein [Burkholderiales bacterium]
MTRVSRRAAIQAGAALGLGLAGVGRPATAQEQVKLRVSHFLSPMAPIQTKLFGPWAQRVEKDSGGRIKIEIYPAMQLGGKPPQLFDQARTGVADIAWALPGYTPGRFPLVEVFELPFMTGRTAEATTQAIWEFYGKHLKDEFKDVHVLLMHCHAPGLVHTKDKLVTRMEDLQGKKIRLPTKPVGDALKLLGATPVGMPLPEAYEALSRGVADAITVPWEVMRPQRLNELVKFHTDTGLYTTVFMVAMNKQKYESLPADLKAVIDKNSGSAIVQEMGKAWDDAEVPGLQQAKEMGHTIGTLSPEEKARWVKTTQPVIDAWIAKTPNGKALYDEAVALIKKYDK